MLSGLAEREEHKLNVFENRLLRTSEPKRDEEIGGRRILHNGELYNMYSSPNIRTMFKSRRMRLPGHVACTEGGEKEIEDFCRQARRK
jgi:hypothetical protein